MYLKLAMRNARRSVMDYLLYIAATVILLSIIFVSNYISVWGNYNDKIIEIYHPFPLCPSCVSDAGPRGGGLHRGVSRIPH